jgi:threonine/homoserine/homoserine lactone efflux protein
VILKNTLSGGRTEGVKTAIGHGLGVGLYALATALGLSVVLSEVPLFFRAVQLLGALFLCYLGIKAFQGDRGIAVLSQTESESAPALHGFRSGFFIAFLNPKLALFFVALFSQFVSPDTLLVAKLIMALTAAGIDTIWYLLVVLLLCHSPLLEGLRRKAVFIDRCFGILLLLLAVRVFVMAVQLSPS